jgi:hypothetical protein
MFYELQKSLASETYRAIDLYEFAKLCQFIDQTLREVDVKYRTREFESASSAFSATEASQSRSQKIEFNQEENIVLSSTSQSRAGSQASSNQINEFTCYNCQDKEHMIKNCRNSRRSRYTNVVSAKNVREMKIQEEKDEKDEKDEKQKKEESSRKSSRRMSRY